MGVQIAGRRFDDLGVLRAAAWYEQHRPAEAVPRWPDRGPDRPGDDMTDRARFQQVEPVRLYQRIVEQIEDAIAAGDLRARASGCRASASW